LLCNNIKYTWFYVVFLFYSFPWFYRVPKLKFKAFQSRDPWCLDIQTNKQNWMDNTVNWTDNSVTRTDNTVNWTDNTINWMDNSVTWTDNTVNSTDNTINWTDNTVKWTDNTVNSTSNQFLALRTIEWLKSWTERFLLNIIEQFKNVWMCLSLVYGCRNKRILIQHFYSQYCGTDPEDWNSFWLFYTALLLLVRSVNKMYILMYNVRHKKLTLHIKIIS